MQSDGASTSVDIGVLTAKPDDPFPFRCELTLRPLIEFWRGDFEGEGSVCRAMGGLIRDAVATAPELEGHLQDLSVLQKHQAVVDALMAAVFAPASWEHTLAAALEPFRLVSFYETTAFQRALMGEDRRLRGRLNVDPETLKNARLCFAYEVILEQVYGLKVDLDYPLLITATDPDSGLDRHYKIAFDDTFLRVRTVGELPVLSEADRERFREFMEVDFLLDRLPPDRFVMEGFTILRAVDVTDHEVLSSIKRDLIERESIVSHTKFTALQDKLRTLFRRPDLRFGLAALDGEKVLILNYGAELEHSCIFADSAHHDVSEFKGTVYEHAVKSGEPLIIRDLSTTTTGHPVEGQMIAAGIRGLVVAPLRYQDRVIGTIELGSPRVGDFTATHLPMLAEILPLFAVAVQRSIDEFNTRVQAFIKEKCTAIHPTVEWRFRKAVRDIIERRTETELDDAQMEMDPIVFPDVYPFYALADIRGSSTRRSLAIQADLLAQLRLAGGVIDQAHREKLLPALDELRYRIAKRAAQIERGLQSGDEVAVIAFLRNDVERLFPHLETFGPRVRDRIAAYRDALDPRLAAVYAERRKFEESVTRLTEAVSAYLDLEEQAAQGMFGHYFEKQKTDGVDYQIYVGASLLEAGAYDPIYLKNLRLWQLMVSCGIAMRAEQMRDRLPMPLEMTHLILVQHSPLAIRFRFDEKRFDVDGAYDIRYEIVKKRIDKALIKGTSERVTQPGTIAIVYSHTAEANEYRGYIEYLQSLGYLRGGVEELELEELQGVHGLRALRVTVDLKSAHTDGTPGASLVASSRA